MKRIASFLLYITSLMRFLYFHLYSYVDNSYFSVPEQFTTTTHRLQTRIKTHSSLLSAQEANREQRAKLAHVAARNGDID